MKQAGDIAGFEDALRLLRAANFQGLSALLARQPNLAKSHDSDGDAILCYAVELGDSKAARLLILTGADPTERCVADCTLLQLAIREAPPDKCCTMLGVLLESGVDIDEVGYLDMTALHIASALGRLDVVRFLVEHGADIDVVTADTQNTPLMEAIESNQEAVCSYLVGVGASTDNVNIYGQSAKTMMGAEGQHTRRRTSD